MTRAAAGDYTVTFDQSVQNCVVQAVNGTGNPNAGSSTVSGAVPMVTMTGGTANQARVRMVSWSGGTAGLTESSFLVAAFC